MSAPAVEELAREYRGKIKVEKVIVDENSLTAGRNGVRRIPTLLLLKVGQIIDKIIGDAPRESLEDLNKRAL
jgi:thioredoxin 1